MKSNLMVSGASVPAQASGCDKNSGTTCCTTSNLCGVGEGGCEFYDSNCFGHLKCGYQGWAPNCPSGKGIAGNCCYDPGARKMIQNLGCFK